MRILLTIAFIAFGSICLTVTGIIAIDYFMQPKPTQTLYVAYTLDGKRAVSAQPGVVSIRTIEGPLTMCIEATTVKNAVFGVCDVQAWILE